MTVDHAPTRRGAARTRVVAAGAVLAVGLMISACSTGLSEELTTCLGQLDYYAGLGATPGYHTTVGEIRDFARDHGAPDPWPDLQPDARAIICYLVGDEPTVPSSWPVSLQRPFDVAVVAMTGDGRGRHGILVLTGMRADIPIQAP